MEVSGPHLQVSELNLRVSEINLATDIQNANTRSKIARWPEVRVFRLRLSR